MDSHTHTICLKFGSPKSLNRQLKFFCDVVPEIMMEPISFLSTDPNTLIFEASTFDKSGASAFILNDTQVERSNGLKNYFDVFFEKLGFSQEQAEKIKKIDQKTTPLWSLLPFVSIKNKPDCYFILISEKFFENVTRACFNNGLFNFSYLSFESERETKVLLKVPAAPHYLLLKFEEEFEASSFWKDEFDLFYPRGKIHSMSKWWSAKLKQSLVLNSEIIALNSIDFQPVLNSIEFDYPETIRQEISEEVLPEVRIKLELKDHYTRVPERSELWYFHLEDLKLLESWLYHLPSNQHQSYVIFAMDGPIKGFIFRMNGIRRTDAPAVSPLPHPRQEFYKPFPAEEIYLPQKKTLVPKLPLEKILEITPFKRDEGLIFFPTIDDFQPLRIPLKSFQPLENLILYILNESSSIESRITPLIQFHDPQTLIKAMEIETLKMDSQLAPEILEPIDADESIDSDVNANLDRSDSSRQPSDIQGEEEHDLGEELLFTDRFLLDQNRAQMISELRHWIVENPTSRNSEPYKRLGILEMLGENYLEGVYLLSLALSLTNDSTQQKQIIRAILNCQLKGEGIRSKIREINSAPFESLSANDLSILSFHTIKEGDKKGDGELRSFLTGYLPRLEEIHFQLPPIIYWNLARGLYECLEPGDYFLYRARDQILFRLLNEELLPPENLAGLLSVTVKHEATTPSYLDQIYEVAFDALQDESEFKNEDRLILHLVFAAGYALATNSQRSQQELESAWELTGINHHPVHKILYETYSQRSQEILEGRGNQEFQATPEDISTLSPAHLYFYETLIENSLLLSNTSESLFAPFDVPGFQNRNSQELLKVIIPRTMESILRSPRSASHHSIDRARSFHAILHVLPNIGENEIFSLFEDFHAKLIPTFNHSERTELLSRMIMLASQFSRTEWIVTLSPDFIECMEELILQNPVSLAQILGTIVELLPRMEDQSLGSEILNFIKRNQAISGQNPKLLVIMARLMDLYGDSSNIEATMNTVLENYFKTPEPSKFDLLIFMLNNWRHASQEFQSEIRQKMVTNLGGFRDHLSLNEAFSISRLLVYEFLVLTPSNTSALSAEGRNLLYSLEHMWKQQLTKTFHQLKEEIL